MKSATDEAIAKIVAGIEADILDRRGLKNELGACDEDIREEIRKAWTKIIRKHMPKGDR